jgi:hypothetical protein
MNSAISIDDAPTGGKKHSPIFLAVFAVFLIATTICLAGTIIGVLAARPSHHDTQWFWASGRLLVHGANPYDREAIRRIETALGLSVNRRDVPMTRNPPSALFLMAPLGLLSARAAMVAWSGLLTAFLIVSVRAIRAMMERPSEPNSLLLAWCFAPALSCIEMGQTGLIVLIGLALFLRFHESGPFWAGMALSLCAVKPHLLLPFGLVLLVWIIARNRWWILAGVVAALTIESLFAMLFDPAVWEHYRAAMRTESIATEAIPTLGVALRFLVDRSAMWLEFVPAALGGVWGLWYFWRNRQRWDWQTHGSVLTLVSLIVAPYSWFTDQVIAIPAILFVLLGIKRPRPGTVTLLLAVMSAAALEMMLVKSIYSKIYILQGMAWLGWYLYATSDETPQEILAVS